MAYLKCKSCRHKEETSLKFFVRVIGAVLPARGAVAWTTYLLEQDLHYPFVWQLLLEELLL
ncbi:hypothetical protein AOH271_07380 [Helicobacter pylori]